MDKKEKETKITYAFIVGFIIILGAVAYFLQPMGIEEKKKEVEASEKAESVNKKSTGTDSQKLEIKTITTQKPMEEKIFTSARIITNKGVIEIAFSEKTPLTVKNFGTLATSNFYDGVRFHRVIKGFMIQAGDPLSKDKANEAAWGTGGPGYKFNDELRGDEQYPLGTVAMANSGPNTNGSQFFIVTASTGAPLPPSYTVFGRVTKGIETALLIENVKTGQADRPLEDVVIEKVEVR